MLFFQSISLTFREEPIKEAARAPFVQSVVIFGRCHLIEDPDVAMETVKRFAMKYYPDEETTAEEITRSGKAVQMYEIEIEHISGKEVQER